MNQPPADSPRIAPSVLRQFVYDAAVAVRIPEEQAALLAWYLVENDLRGGFSHGSLQMLRYAREIRSGGVNPTPTLKTVRETPTSVLIDGDFGLGYFPLREATLMAIDKAKQHGMAAAVTRHHGHIGAAGIYTRLTLEHDLCTFVTSGVQLDLQPGDGVLTAAGGSPMSFSAPADREPPLVLDCGVTHDMQGPTPQYPDLCRMAPGAVLRAIGFGTICQTWGGLLTGLPIDRARAPQQFKAANQGAMLFTFQIALFADPAEFKREVDEYARRVRTLTPIEGTEGAFLPGGVEAKRASSYLAEGIPLGDKHRQILATLAGEVGVKIPW